MKSLCVVLISLIMCSLIYSQEDSTKRNWALSFGIANDFRLTNFNMDIAVKKIIDDEQLRLFLSPNVATRNDDQTSNGQTSKIDYLDYSIGVGADYLWTLITEDDFNLFSGTGLVFTFGNTHSKTTSTDTDGNNGINDASRPFTSVGLRGTLGVEWKVTENIGLHSEYLLTGSYFWNKTEAKSSLNGIENPIQTRKSSGITLGTSVLFGISIYL